MNKQTREKNNNWKGGRVIASNGYVLIRVGLDHHLADSRGYVYEHRLIAEQKLGHQLSSSDVIHHIDGDKQNNSPDNLQVFTSHAEHMTCHPPHNKRPDNPLVECACGCGQTMKKYRGVERRYISGHNRRGLKTSKITESQRFQIAEMAAVGMTHSQIGAQVGLHQSTVTRIINGRR